MSLVPTLLQLVLLLMHPTAAANEESFNSLEMAIEGRASIGEVGDVSDAGTVVVGINDIGDCG